MKLPFVACGDRPSAVVHGGRVDDSTRLQPASQCRLAIGRPRPQV